MSFFKNLFGKSEKEESEATKSEGTDKEQAGDKEGEAQSEEKGAKGSPEATETENQEESEEPEVINEDDLDPTDMLIPRVLYFKSFGSNPGPCPRCRSKVDNHTSLYAVIAKIGEEETLMVIGSELGWFCTDCPTMFLNPDKFFQGIRAGMGAEWDMLTGFVPLGLVDPDKLQEQESEEVGEDEEEPPLPVIPFLDLRTFGRGSSKIRTPGKKGKKKKKKKR